MTTHASDQESSYEVIDSAINCNLVFFLSFLPRCTGSEATLGDCPKRTGSVAQSFGHKRDAGLECNVPTPCPDPDGRVCMYTV